MLDNFKELIYLRLVNASLSWKVKLKTAFLLIE